MSHAEGGSESNTEKERVEEPEFDIEGSPEHPNPKATLQAKDEETKSGAP